MNSYPENREFDSENEMKSDSVKEIEDFNFSTVDMEEMETSPIETAGVMSNNEMVTNNQEYLPTTTNVDQCRTNDEASSVTVEVMPFDQSEEQDDESMERDDKYFLQFPRLCISEETLYKLPVNRFTRQMEDTSSARELLFYGPSTSIGPPISKSQSVSLWLDQSNYPANDDMEEMNTEETQECQHYPREDGDIDQMPSETDSLTNYMESLNILNLNQPVADTGVQEVFQLREVIHPMKISSKKPDSCPRYKSQSTSTQPIDEVVAEVEFAAAVEKRMKKQRRKRCCKKRMISRSSRGINVAPDRSSQESVHIAEIPEVTVGCWPCKKKPPKPKTLHRGTIMDGQAEAGWGLSFDIPPSETIMIPKTKKDPDAEPTFFVEFSSGSNSHTDDTFLSTKGCCVLM